LGYDTAVDEKIVAPVAKHFTAIAKREGFTIGAPVEYDFSQYQHQVPGGMLSNLRHQLRKVGLEHRFPEALEETIRVRAEFGYPIMVTPLSQFVGSQAAINVIVGERYKEVTDQIIQYALGYWGKEGAELMDPSVKAKILDRPRAKEWARWQPPEPSVQEIRKKMNAEGVSDEDLLLRWNLSVDEIATMRAAGAPKEYLTARQPLVNLLDALSKRSDYRQIVVQKGEMVISLQKGAPA
jgi:oxaloacetate decarboxylase alpha subunit